MKRKNCVICNNRLDDFCSFTFPLLNHATNKSINDDIVTETNYGVCSKCSSVQITNLIDPNILYSYANKHELTSLWKTHHNEFTNFIKQSINIKDRSICEIGGGNNGLFEYMSEAKTYSILDIYESTNKIGGIKYKIGNCEEYQDYTDSSLVMSHTFEHLYNPINFIKSLKNSTVNDIFISVPNMKYMLDNKTNISIVFSEHTFYFEKEDIIYMFGINGYKCISNNKFENHSLFFHFQKTTMTINNNLHIKEDSKDKLYDLFKKRITKLNIDIDDKYYIMPSHYIGQAAYYSINNSENIVGFLDNDLNKVGKRLYGTSLYIYKPELLDNVYNMSYTILLIKTPYYNEMYNQLMNINPNLKIIPFNLI